jgi:uncharacterized protein (DUF1330 family)
MAKGYWIACYRSISKPDALPQYAELAGPAIAAAGGKFLARGGQVQPFEAGLKERTVLIEFDSYDTAVATYNSPAYQEALKKFDNAAERDIRIVEGLD